ncbi:hypothetical protein CDCA_CDCA02G0810 [Cyanidium caldarium]|uniref:Uncharacterized protein n=1 Tax=Cyanidium caldarium TaxID=2771 RepID=A0AAV9IR51_CYACA|nr:hypothetical protein CDCA_CDCA02G0810 [Cyanidium caldarium]
MSVCAGLFEGLFGGKRRKSPRDLEREEQMRIMADKLAARREGRHLEGVDERRRKIQEALDTKEKPQPGEDPLIAWKRQRDKERAAGTWKEVGYTEEDESGIPVPMASFGIPRYDNGERFDLRLPYVDQGYVDEEADVMGKLFGGKRKKSPESEDHQGQRN